MTNLDQQIFIAFVDGYLNSLKRYASGLAINKERLSEAVKAYHEIYGAGGIAFSYLKALYINEKNLEL